MQTSDFDYDLPAELIAQHPPTERSAARMLALNRETGECALRCFQDLREYLRPGDCVVLNDTRVIPARLFGIKEGGGARIELLLLRPQGDGGNRWAALVRPARRVRRGAEIRLLDRSGGETAFSCRLVDRVAEEAILEFDGEADAILARCGHMPLPPYIRREDELSDQERYQTVFARNPGAVAAPTAGLHFTPGILDGLRADGVRVAELTLHVGPGTFRPVAVEDLREHRMHTERYVLPSETAAAINGARRAGGRIVAVGTTVVRVLESCADADGLVRPGAGETDIFLHPPCRLRAVDLLLTNFHLPRSTLLMLVCCLADRERVLAAYRLAVARRLRFYSYGDCMLLWR
jgi:S-adenosylmethionine:tRNA ribosyltransferase-isomerase